MFFYPKKCICWPYDSLHYNWDSTERWASHVSHRSSTVYINKGNHLCVTFSRGRTSGVAINTQCQHFICQRNKPFCVVRSTLQRDQKQKGGDDELDIERLLFSSRLGLFSTLLLMSGRGFCKQIVPQLQLIFKDVLFSPAELPADWKHNTAMAGPQRTTTPPGALCSTPTPRRSRHVHVWDGL